jgi:alpha-tubulin suppressor-like RCC1 family protein
MRSHTWSQGFHRIAAVVFVALLSGCAGSDSTTVPPGPAPKPPVGALRFVDISLGAASCGVAIGGAAYCWGPGDFGEIGNGVWDSLGGTSRVAQRTRPTAVLGGHTFTSISAGWSSTCGIATNGAAYCWGLDTYGSLGSGSTPESSTVVPTPAAIAGGFSFDQLSAGYLHACGLTRSGAAVCWGLVGSGMPAIVPAFVGRSFARMNVGGSSAYGACFLDTAGVAFCGIGGDSVLAPFAWTSMSVGFEHICALTATGQAYCWGYNDKGQLGNDSTTLSCNGFPCSDGPLAVTGGLTFLSVSAGQEHSCGVTTAHDVYCWGAGGFGELGDGSRTQRGVTPRKVAGGLSFASVSAGYIDTCGLTTDGFAYCWGEGGFGNLGSGSLSSALVPVPVAAP